MIVACASPWRAGLSSPTGPGFPDFSALGDALHQRGAQHLLLTGGLRGAAHLMADLDAVVDAVGVPVSFVLAPDDYVGGSIPALRADVAAKVRITEHLDWVGMGAVLPLGKGRALVGHGGWGDLREGHFDGRSSEVYACIRELQELPPDRLERRLLRLGADAAQVLGPAVRQAAMRCGEVVVLCHQAPFLELIPPSMSPARRALQVCGAMGRVLREVAEQFPEVQLRVQCAAADVPGPVVLAPNLIAHGRGPGPWGLRFLDLPELEPRVVPGTAGNPLPLAPMEEAATIAIPRSDLGRRGHPGLAEDPADIEALLYRVFDEPPEGLHPLPSGESPGQWSAAVDEAIENIVTKGIVNAMDASGVRLGTWLDGMLRGPVAPSLVASVGRRHLVGELLRNLAQPGRINQGHKGTCAVTCVEVWLAERHPAELARIVAGLMRPEGQALLYNGEAMLRDEDRLVWSAREARRRPASRVFQVAAMEYAYPEADYRNDEDARFETNTAGVEVNVGTGLGLSAFDRLLEGTTGTSWCTLSDRDGAMAEAFAKLGIDTSFMPRIDRDGEGIIRRCLDADAGCFVTLEPADARSSVETREVGDVLTALPHKVRVLGIDEAGDRVQYEDPYDPAFPWIPGVASRIEDAWGRCSMGRADFLSLIVEISFPPRFAPGG